jgi:hypothetical protein
MFSKPKVLVCVLCGTERQHWINPELSQMLFKMGRDPRFDVEVATIKDAAPVEVARNHTIKIARDHHFDWLVSFDADNFMPSGTPLDIIADCASKRSVIGLTYGTQKHQSAYTLFPPDECRTTIEGQFAEVPSVGGGVLIVNKKVWEKIPTGPWFRWEHGNGEETLDRGAGGRGEDVYFCELVRKNGFRVWTHRTLLAGHYRTTDLTGMVCTMAQMGRRA